MIEKLFEEPIKSDEIDDLFSDINIEESSVGNKEETLEIIKAQISELEAKEVRTGEEEKTLTDLKNKLLEMADEKQE